MNGPSMTAADKFDRGMGLYRKYTQGDNARARVLFGEVLEATEPGPTATAPNQPLAARACAGLAVTYRQEWNFEWDITVPGGLPDKERQAMAWAKKSVDLDGSLPDGHVQLAYLYLYQMNHDQAAQAARAAIRRGGPNYAAGYAVLAQVLTYSGEPEIAVPLMEKALRLDRQAPLHLRQEPVFLRQLGQAYYVWGQVEKYAESNGPQAMVYYQKAEEYLKRAMEVNRQVRLTLAAVYMEMGGSKVSEAHALFDKDPDMRLHIDIGQRRQQAPYKDQPGYTGGQSIRERYIDALKRAEYSGGTP